MLNRNDVKWRCLVQCVATITAVATFTLSAAKMPKVSFEGHHIKWWRKHMRWKRVLFVDWMAEENTTKLYDNIMNQWDLIKLFRSSRNLHINV